MIHIMTFSAPSYLSKNRLGTYYFRCRIPEPIKLDNDFYLSASKSRSEQIKETVSIDSAEGRTIVTVRREKNNCSEKLSDLLDKYCAENSSRWDGTYEHKDVRPIIGVLCEVTGDKLRSSFGTEDVVKFKEVYVQLPKNRKKVMKYKEKSINELLKMQIPSEDRLSLTTVKTNFNILITFFSWCFDNKYFAEDVSIPLRRFNRQNKKQHLDYEERDPFKEKDLKRLFENETYLHGLHKKASEQWVPLIALFTGCILKEICQLFKEDIKIDNESGIFYFDISADPKNGKTLETKSSKRSIPIHRNLIEIGFLQYVSSIKLCSRLFPDIKANKSGDLTHAFSKLNGLPDTEYVAESG
ncbi:MAG: hypothetical protein ACTFAK_09825 [Candidatus Electronema sp. VV]